MKTIQVIHGEKGDNSNKICKYGDQLYYYVDVGYIAMKFIFQPIGPEEVEKLISGNKDEMNQVHWDMEERLGNRNFLEGEFKFIYPTGEVEIIE